jgi:Flp pilus assembly protein TadB
MTKLEELTALLVNELNDFNKGIERLEKISKQLKDTKIKMDVAEYKTIIEAHQQQMASHLNSIERFESRFNNKIEGAKMYPTWAVVVFMVCIVVTVALSSYLVFYR